MAWWSYILPNARRLGAPRLIPYAEVATHNHFVLDRGGKVFKQTAPVIKLPSTSDERAHFEILGGRLFVVGVVPRGASAGDWVAGLPTAFAWDKVQDYIIFDSAADYAKRIERYVKRKRRRKA